MAQNRERFVLPVLVIAVGVALLLDVRRVLPGVEWIFPVVFAAAGLLTLYVRRFDKITFVFGPALLVASVTSFLRETGRLSLECELPILIIVLGGLMLLAQLLNIGLPESPKARRGQEG